MTTAMKFIMVVMAVVACATADEPSVTPAPSLPPPEPSALPIPANDTSPPPLLGPKGQPFCGNLWDDQFLGGVLRLWGGGSTCQKLPTIGMNDEDTVYGVWMNTNCKWCDLFA
jgi:hypothetical protein